jgi:hypothetical protein
MGISKKLFFWCQSLRWERLQKLINTINFQYLPIFVSEEKKLAKKSVCRGVELTMMKASYRKNNGSNGEIVGILVCKECISPYNGGW